MGLCTFCGQPAGWFRSTHQSCADRDVAERGAEVARQARAAQERSSMLAALAADVTATIKVGGDLVALEGRLLNPVAAGSLVHSDMRKALITGWQQAVAQLLDDDILSEEEESNLQAARARFDLDQVSLDSDGSFSRAAKAAILRSAMLGEPHSGITLPDGCPVNLQRGERPVWSFADVGYLEDRQRRQFVGGSQGVSVRIMSGVYYRVGAFKGESVYSTQRHHLGQGMLLVTDQNLYFHNAAKSLRIPYRKIVSFTPYSDGIGVMRDAQTAKPQIFVTKDGWFSYNLITNLARAGTR